MSNTESLFDLFLGDIPEAAGSQLVPEHGDPSRKIWLVLACADEKAITKKDVLGTTYGHVLQQVMHQANLRRDDVHICTINPYSVSTYAQARFWRPGVTELGKFLTKIETHKPRLIVAVGESAMNALTSCDGIDKWRGSFVESKVTGTTVMPIYDPFRLFVEEELRFVTQIDLKKVHVRREDYIEPQRRYVIDPRYDECINYLDHLKHDVKLVSTDIETRNNTLSCIGFSHSPYEAFVVPFARRDTLDKCAWTQSQEQELLLRVESIMGDPSIEKIFQNGMYDTTFMWEFVRIKTRGRIWDTMNNHHLLYPDFKKNLGFLTSIYTLDPYYKDEGKIWQDSTISDEIYWTYNAKDADTTYRIHLELVRRLKKYGYWDVARHLSDLFPMAFDMSIRGIRVDVDMKDRLGREADDRLEILENKINLLVGHELNTGSPKQMLEYLYKELALPVQYQLRKDKETGAKKKTPTANEKAILELRKQVQGMNFKEGTEQRAWQTKTLSVFNLILDHRELSKLNGTYYKCPISSDGRIRASFSLAGPDTGRFASSKYIDDTGTNLQNQTGGSKLYLVPNLPDEEGPHAGVPHVLVNVDLSQAEARVVANESGDPGLLYLFNSGVDYHSANAMNIWGFASVDDVPKDKRQLAKVGGHATNYDISSHTLAISLGLSLREAQEFHSKYFAAYPQLKKWQLDTKNEMVKYRKLTNLLGRQRMYLGKMDDDTFRSGLAFKPQSTVADVINRGLMKVLKLHPWLALLLQCHDSGLFSLPITLVDWFIPILRSCIEMELITKAGRTFVIPADFEIGLNYKDMIRYTTPEQEQEAKLLLAEGLSPVKISHQIKCNKDAVIALSEGQTFRNWYPEWQR